MPRFFVELPDRHFDMLGKIAQEDCRAPRDEAAYLLRDAVQRRVAAQADAAKFAQAPADD